MTVIAPARKHPLAECERCPLYEEGQFVPSVGPAEAKIAVVGEAPGAYEARQGEPFIGESGQLLNKILQHYKITRKEIFLSNACLCRQPDGATPTATALSACRPRLLAELQGRKVETVVALGGSASQSILATKEGITKLRLGSGRTSTLLPDVRIIPTFHPAAALRSPDFFPSIVNDFGKLNGFHSTWYEPKWKAFEMPEEALQALAELQAIPGPVVVDIESGIEKDVSFDHPNRHTLLCVGLGYTKGKVVVIGETALRDPRVIEALIKYLLSHPITCQNGKFDLKGLYPKLRAALRLAQDTMLKHYCTDERAGIHSLEYLGIELLGTPSWKGMLDKYKKTGESYAVIPRPVLYQYNAWDVHVTDLVNRILDAQLATRPELQNEHDFLIRASNQLMYVELNGIGVDLQYNSELTVQYTASLEMLRGRIQHTIPGEPWMNTWAQLFPARANKIQQFNPNSPKQVAGVVEGIFGLRLPMKMNQKKEYAKTTDAEALEGLLARNLGKPSEEFFRRMLEHRKEAKLYGCVDEQTEILTLRGWLKYNQVEKGDLTLSINPKTGLSEWNKIEDVHLYPGEHDLVHIEGRDFSALVTHDHRWLTNRTGTGGVKPGWTWRTTDTLTVQDRIPKAATRYVPSNSGNGPLYPDEFVEIVAWLWTEGSIDGSGLNITQSHAVNESNVARIRSALITLCPNPEKDGVPYTTKMYWSERPRADGMTEFYINPVLARQFMNVFINHKVVDPRFIKILTRAQLQLFVDVSMLGDGTPGGDGSGLPHISQNSQEQLFAFHLACCLLGTPTRCAQREDGQYHIWLHKEPFLRAKRTGTQTKPGLTWTNVKHTGTVWCVSTFNKNWLARRRGNVYYTGNTYVKGLRRRVYHGRVFPTFLLHGTTTGRLSCRNPNLQNIPRDSAMRRQFVPTSSDNVFIEGDYGQNELRVLCWLAQDEYLRGVFNDPTRDLFTELTPRLYGDVSKLDKAALKELRIRVKAYVYGLSYGREAPSIAMEFGVPVTEAERGMHAFFEVIPSVVRFREETRKKVLNGYDLVTPVGRHRRFMLITKSNRKDVMNEALAFLPQSIASDICLNAFVYMRPALTGIAFIRNIVHDSLLVETPKDRVDEVKEIMRYHMLEAAKRIVGDYVAFKVDFGVGPSWGELN